MKHGGAKRFLIAFLALTLAAGCQTGKRPPEKLVYPETKTVKVVEDFHGVKVADPYRWLEDLQAPEVRQWIDAQNRLTRSYLDNIPFREKIQKRLEELWNYPRYSVPQKHGNRYFFFKNDGLQNQSVLYMVESLEAEPVVVIDPNKFSPDGTVALRSMGFSRDGRYLAYGLSSSGSDRQEIHIRDIDTGKDFEEVIRWCKFTSIAWKPDNSGFFYNRYPKPGTVPKEDENNYSRVYFHRLGTPQEEDVLIYERPDRKEWGFSPQVTEDGNYLLIYVWHGTDPKNRVYYQKLEGNGKIVKLLDRADASYTFIGNVGETFYFRTDLDAPRGRIIAIDLKRPQRRHWKVIIPEQEEVIDFARMIDNRLMVVYMKDAHHIMKVYDLSGQFEKEIKLPTLGSVSGLSGRQKDKEFFFGFTSFLFPTNIYRYDFETGKLTLFRSSEIDFDASKYETKQVFYRSKDGTRVPMFLTHKKGLKLDGKNPALLYGYGGFNISLTPSFSAARLLWLENGGVFALANLRGGNEYGEEWHRAGMLQNKQNVFDDFIAAAEWLIENGYTSKERLAIRGGSNGGLLVAATMVQRPDLFGAVVCQVPVIDMLRYHRFTVGHFWIPEYGDPGNPEHFRFLYAYSPLHNVKPGTCYPPILITTADTDDRVYPAHSLKFTAALQAAQACDNPILLRYETKAGHGGGKPTSKRIEEYTDLYAFLFYVLGMKP